MPKANWDRGVKVLNRIGRTPFYSLLKGWIEATEKYCSSFVGGDSSYFTNERSNISLLAGGAWLAGGSAIEEYPTNRRRTEGDERGGRCDLYVGIGKGAEVEAKAYLFRAPEKDALLFKQVREKMAQAVADASSLAPTYKRAGCVFYAVRIAGSQDMADEELEAATRSQLERFQNALAPCSDIYGWCFPAINRKYWDDHHGDFVPGVITAFKVVE